MDVVLYKEIESKILTIRGQQIIIDSDIAGLYEVETKRINEAVKTNPEKFPDGYLFELLEHEKNELVGNSDRFARLKHSTVMPKAFTESGLYMLATILKSSKATETTLAIIDTFAKFREVSRIVNQLPTVKENTTEHRKLIQRAGDVISDLVVPDNLVTAGTEASIELNFAVVKFKYSLKKRKKS